MGLYSRPDLADSAIITVAFAGVIPIWSNHPRTKEKWSYGQKDICIRHNFERW